ncbi:MAG: TetR/AcrR family transcriptional regulator [Anaerolineales bacterium]|nr:TetR/AcrR family transcriptional regulator [Anaerolineales bacterium]
MPAKKDIEATRRRQILDAAEIVFAARGIEKTRMDDIVHESGLSKGALYWYFKSKDAIISAMLDRVFISEMREAEALVDAQAPSSERLKTFVAYAVLEYKRFEKLLPLAYEFFAIAARSKAVRETIAGYFKRYTSLLARIIQQGVDNHEFRACDPEAVAISVIGMYEGVAMLWFIQPELVDCDRMGTEPIELLLAGLMLEKR